MEGGRIFLKTYRASNFNEDSTLKLILTEFYTDNDTLWTDNIYRVNLFLYCWLLSIEVSKLLYLHKSQ